MMLLLALLLALAAGPAAAAPAGAFGTPLAADNLDPAAFCEWVDGAERPLDVKDGPRHVVWTQTTAPEWDGVRFGDSKQAGVRHLRIAWKAPLAVGSVLVRAGGRLSVLKPGAAYPGNLADDAQWIPAVRLAGREVTRKEAGREEYALWVLPPGTTTRALRFTHDAAATDREYAGWLGGAALLTGRYANMAPQAFASARANSEKAGRINDGTNNGTWNAWDNGKEGADEVVSPEHPEWVILTWPKPVSLAGLAGLWAGFGAADAQAYIGPADRHPRDATDADWQTIRSFQGMDSQYPRSLGVNWMDFGQAVTTRAIRLRITAVTREGHPHLNGNTKGGKRIWLGEVMALQPLASAPVETAVLPAPPAAAGGHPPIPIRFTLKEPGFVTLVIEDATGKRVRNLVSETPFPAGRNVAWWDGMDDLGRDVEAPRHGIYWIPGRFVAPGAYRVRGLYRKALHLRYEMSVYNSGKPVWETADGTGCWLTNHTPPSAALYVPAEQGPAGKPLVYLGSYVAEGGHGLAWVDLDGRKQGGRGWVGGAWTGAPYLARDVGTQPDPDTYVYVGSAWEGELRLTALTKKGDRQVVKFTFPSKEESALAGIAVRDGLMACSLPKQKELLFVDCKAGKVLGTTPLEEPQGVAFAPDGRLLAISGKSVVVFLPPAGFPPTAPKPVVSEGLEEPQGIALDAQGNILVSDWGQCHQVKVFSPEGKLLRAIGRPGVPKAGPYDPLHMNHPNGLTVDERGRLWVAETDFQPKRVSVWAPDGKLVKAFYGPGQYGGGGTLDPLDKTRFYYNGMEFHLDWKAGTDKLVSVFYRPGPGELRTPEGHYCDGMPETPIYANGRQYMTNAYDSNPTNGAGIAMLWVMQGGIARPVAALGRANDWDLLKGDAFKPLWPEGVDLKGDYWRNQAIFAWSDLNGDAQVQPDEVAFLKATGGGVTVMPDLSFVESRVDDRAVRFPPLRFTAQGVPVYALAAGQTLVAGAQGPTSSGGDQALWHPDGWSIFTVAPKPFAPQSLGGAFKGKALWSYPSLWPGLHASHESPPPDRPGEIIGTTRLLGGFVRPKGSDAGPLWCVNGNQGNMYLFTADGLFVAQLFQDVRQGTLWAMPVAQRGMLLDTLTLHDENFWPSITQTADGTIYLVDGARTSLVRVEGLETLRRLPASSIKLTAADLEAARAYQLRVEAERQKEQGGGILTVPIRTAAPTVDGKLDDWAGAQWATIDKRGVAAYFNSNSQPYNVTAAVAVAGDRLYAAFRTGDKDLLRNSGATANAPFKDGGALDLMIGADPQADPNRRAPAAGDERLLVTVVKGKTLALLYRAVVPGTREPVKFSSPWRTITIDRVEDISQQVQLAGSEGDYELSVPLALLGLKPAAGVSIKGDIGILRGNGFQTSQRVYWSNKATGIVADVPSEAELTPQLWGVWQFSE